MPSPKTIQDIRKNSKLKVVGRPKATHRNVYELTLICTRGWCDTYHFAGDSDEAMEELAATLYLLSKVQADEDSKYYLPLVAGEPLSPEQAWKIENDALGWEVQQHIIHEAGKDIFFQHNPDKPICCMFPMNKERRGVEYYINDDFPKYDPGIMGIQLLSDTEFDEWAYEEDEKVRILSWALQYYTPEGSTCAVEYSNKLLEEKGERS